MADAITAGWRVAGLVAPVASLIRRVACAAMARAAKVSPLRFCESVNASPAHPRASAISASARVRPATGNVPSQNSTMQALLDLAAHVTHARFVELVA